MTAIKSSSAPGLSEKKTVRFFFPQLFYYRSLSNCERPVLLLKYTAGIPQTETQ